MVSSVQQSSLNSFQCSERLHRQRFKLVLYEGHIGVLRQNLADMSSVLLARPLESQAAEVSLCG